MKRFLFISRHVPSQKQLELAAAQGVELIYVGDLDAFAPDLAQQIEALDRLHCPDREEDGEIITGAYGVVAVHPLVAVTAVKMSYQFGTFRNVNRAPVGEKPEFDTDLFVLVKL